MKFPNSDDTGEPLQVTLWTAGPLGSQLNEMPTDDFPWEE
jgi:hypothetical protein